MLSVLPGRLKLGIWFVRLKLTSKPGENDEVRLWNSNLSPPVTLCLNFLRCHHRWEEKPIIYHQCELGRDKIDYEDTRRKPQETLHSDRDAPHRWNDNCWSADVSGNLKPRFDHDHRWMASLHESKMRNLACEERAVGLVRRTPETAGANLHKIDTLSVQIVESSRAQPKAQSSQSRT